MSNPDIKNPRPANDEDLRINPEAGNAADEVCYRFELYAAAKTPVDQASALVELSNAISGLSTWIPGYNSESGEIERGEQF